MLIPVISPHSAYITCSNFVVFAVNVERKGRIILQLIALFLEELV